MDCAQFKREVFRVDGVSQVGEEVGGRLEDKKEDQVEFYFVML